MRFAFTDDQKLFAEGLRDLLAKECTPAQVRAAWDEGAGHDFTLWNHLGEMGVFGMLVPEAAGGLGGTEIDLVLLLEELGRAAVPGPIFETAAVVAPALGDGATVGTAALDGSPYVPHAHVASVVLVPGGVIRTASSTLSAVDAIDGGRRLFTVDGPVEPFAYDEALAFDRGALAAAAYLVGLSERMIDVAAEYALAARAVRPADRREPGGEAPPRRRAAEGRVRQAGGVPRGMVRRRGRADAARDVSMAKAFASDAAYRSSRSAMQVHGAIGYTWEADLQLWMKKAWALQRAWGDATFHRRRVAEAVL